ncbi:hypothetical protein [Burkholderia anthina]|uniref:hypothetical protein n=1 Tax=Burkholderia anthina TaxID=179879 RepID=UPI0037C12594
MKHFIPSASIAAALAVAFALSACATQPPSPLPADVAGQDTQDAQTAQAAPTSVGGDRDAHGCIGSAGYAWCERTQQCERPWELAKAHGITNSAQVFEQFCRNGGGK